MREQALVLESAHLFETRDLEDLESEDGLSRGKRRRWGGRRAAGVGLSLALIALFFALGAGVVALTLGRLNLDAFRPALVSALQQRLGHGYRLQIGGMAIERQGSGLVLALKRVSLTGADGARLVTAPKADLVFDPFSILAGQIKPSRVELDGLDVELRVLPNGDIDLRAGGGKRAAASPAAPRSAPQSEAPASQPSVEAPTSAPPSALRAQVIRQAAQAINRVFDLTAGGNSPISMLDHFGVRRGRLIIDDRVAGQKRGFDDFNFSLDRERVNGAGVVVVDMSARDPSGLWSVRAAARGARNGPHDLSIEASGFSIDEIALLAGKIKLPINSDIPLSLKASASFGGDGHVVDANARLDLGAGFWRFADPDFAPVFIDEVFAAAHWDAANHRALVDEAQIFSGQTRFFLNGVIAPPAHDGAPWRIKFRETEPGVIGPDRIGETPVTLTSFHGDLSVDLPDKILTVHRVEVIGPQVAAAAQGTLDWANGPHLRLGLAARDTSAAGVLALWPNVLVAPVRGWLGDHLLGGTLKSLRMAVDLDKTDLLMMRAQIPPMPDRIVADYVVKNASFSFLDGAPPITGLDGVGHSDGRSTRFNASVGHIQSPSGKTVNLSNGVMSVPDAAIKPVDFSVSAHGEGSLQALGEILSTPGFAKVARLPLDPKTTKGHFEGDFTWRTKLAPVYNPKAARIEVSAKVDHFSVEHLVGKGNLEDANLSVTLKDGVTDVAGKGKIFGAPATLELTKSGVQPTHGVVSFAMDDAARAKAGLNTGATVVGPVGVKITGDVGAAHPQAQVDLDLSKTALNAPLPGVYKPAGQPGKASFLYRQDANGAAQFDKIVFNDDVSSARGAVKLGPDGKLLSARFPQVKFSPGDDLRIDATKSGGVLKIIAHGKALDARPFLKSLTSNAGGPDGAGDFSLDLSVDVLSGANQKIASDATLHVVKVASQFQALNFSGKFGADAVQGQLTGAPAGGAPLLRVTTTDGGDLLAFLDLYSHMEGGKLTCKLKLSDGEVSGPLDVKDFVLRGEPALRSFAASPNAQGFAAKVKLNPNVVAFSRLHAFLDKKKGRLIIRNGAISNPEIGSTLDGWIDFSKGTLDVSGTFVPVYGVNNLFGRLPVVGILLGGGSHEGLIGLNFRVSGKTSAPVLAINPLSAIAPGFLRKIFGVLPIK